MLITHLLLFILLSCENPFNPLNTEKPNDGTGYFLLSINGVSVGRTILPVTGQNVVGIEMYRLEFTSSTGNTNLSYQITNDEISDPVPIPSGTWDLHVIAYDSDWEPVGEGNLAGIVIKKGETVTRNITLTAFIGNGEGTFKWKIAYPEDVTTASMTITPLDTGRGTYTPTLYFTNTGNEDNKVDTEDSLTLNTGYYRVVFNLGNSNGQNAMRREILHIYKDRESLFQFTFVQEHFNDKIVVTSNANSGAGSLWQAIYDAPDGSTIVIDSNVGTIALTGSLLIDKDLVIEGNGVTITRDLSWTAINNESRLLTIIGSDTSAAVSISRVHFKDGRTTNIGAAIRSIGNLSLESCIFSGNQSSNNGGAIFHYGTMSVKGCTFYGNSSGSAGGAIYYNGNTLTLEGNLFYRNTAASGPVVYRDNGTVTSSGYNVVDVELGTGSAQSGFTVATGDKQIGVMPVSPVNLKLLSNSAAAGIITSLPLDYPAVDFYGNPITVPAAAGAVQTSVSGSGFTLDLSVNNSARGSIGVTPAPDADGFVSGNITVTASPDTNYEFAYWLVDGERAGSANPFSFNITSHTRVYAVFTRTYTVDNFTDESGSANTPGTLRHAITNAQNDDIIRFSGVTAGTSAVRLKSALPDITSSVIIEGNGITITRDSSWTYNLSRLLYIGGSGAVVSISRVHFKDGLDTGGAAAAIDNHGNLSLESCIFSGNQNISSNASSSSGGAVHNNGTMSVKGCTFYRNSSRYRSGGAIYNTTGTLTLEGNLFYENTAASYPVVYSGGTVTSNGYNVVDVTLGTGTAESGFTATTGDKTISLPPVSPVSFKLLTYSGAAGVITSWLSGYPTVDFYGASIPASSAAAGAVQAMASGSGYILELSVNNSAGGSVSVTPAPNADGLVYGNVTITAALNQNYVLAYWLVNGEKVNSPNPLSFPIDAYTSVQAVFTRTFTVNNFTDESGSADTPGTLRHAITNAGNNDIIRFTGVTAGTSVVRLTSALPSITSIVSIEGNGITITRDSSWTYNLSRLLGSGSGAVVTVSRVHFKDDRSTTSGVAISSSGNLSLESCIFSGNRSNGNGGAISNSGTMSVKGCTFYGNSSIYGGAINNQGTLTLEGNLFYRNTATSSGPVVYSYSGTVTSNGYNVVDVALGTGTAQSGFTAHSTDKTVSVIPVSPVSFKLLSGNGAAGVITSLPSGYPTADFYGNPINNNAAAGAVQSTAYNGYYLEVSVNNSDRGSVSITSAPNADGLVSGTVTITAVPQYPYVTYWLVNGEIRGPTDSLSFNITTHTTVLAVFTRIFTVNIFTDESGSVAQAGTLRHAITNAQNDDIIRFTNVTPGTSVVRLTSALPYITSSISIEGSGITITQDSSWTETSISTQLLCISGSSTVVSISRVHFKDGRATYNGAAINNLNGNLSLESCVFSGNQSSNRGGAIYHQLGTMSVKGCTFYGNSGDLGGAINCYFSTLTLEGNLFYRNTATSSGPVVYRNNGTVTSNGYNVVDVALGTSSGQSGFISATGDKTISDIPVSPVSFRLLSGSEAAGVLTSLPSGYPTVDFYGASIPASSAAAGAVQSSASGTGFTLELSVNNSARGSVSITPAPDADGLVSGNVTITASPNTNYEFAYWLVDGENKGSANPYSFAITDHTFAQAVFSHVFVVNNFSDESGSADTPGTLRHAITNAQNSDTIRFTGVTPGTSAVRLKIFLPQITSSVSIEGNGITITRDSSWTTSFTELLNIGPSAVVSISRVHFKDGRATSNGAAIYNSGGNLSLVSCIFSGNQNSGNYTGGAISNYSGTMSVKGCTFYGNSGNPGGAIYTSLSTLILEGNLFYGNNAASGPVVNSYGGTVTSNGYNVVDVALGTNSGQSGFTALSTDKTLATLLGSNDTSPFTDAAGGNFAPVTGIQSVMPNAAIEGFPVKDFFGNDRTWPGAPGAVK